MTYLEAHLVQTKVTPMPANHTEIEKRLWDAADELRANSRLKSSEYSVPVLGLIFLRYADHRFGAVEEELCSGERWITYGRFPWIASSAAKLSKDRSAPASSAPSGKG